MYVCVFQCVAACCACCHYSSAVVLLFFKWLISVFCLSFIYSFRWYHLHWIIFLFTYISFSLSFWLAHCMCCLRARCENHTLYKISWTWPSFISSFYDFVEYFVHFKRQFAIEIGLDNVHIQLHRAVHPQWAFAILVTIAM